MYFAYSAGYTANSEDIFSPPHLPYLQSVTSDYDVEAWINKYSGGTKSLESTQRITSTQVKNNLTANLSSLIKSGTSIEYESGTFPIYEKTLDSHNNYVITTNAWFTNKSNEKQYVTGQQIRTAAKLNSPCFSVFDYDTDADMLFFKVTGYGHGVGMSQYGAIGYANNESWSYKQILRHYYSITSASAHQLVAPIW
jgi:stage II sporulation protein D